MYFDELDLNDDILDALDDMNFVECTPIQEQAIPLVLSGRDLLGSAQTGTGKTAAYLLPILELLSRGNSNPNKVNALILVPTRELAQQVDQLLGGFAYYQGTSWIAVYGGSDGVAFSQQQRAFAEGGDIAVATPGRLLSLIRSTKIDLSGIDYLVIDEADRMLDIGFYDDIMDIISYLPTERQTLMFSATFPDDVAKLARRVLHNPAEVKIAISKPAEGITQSVYLLQEMQKLPLISHIFAQSDCGKAIVFLSSKAKVKELFMTLHKMRLKVAQIHSDLENEVRSQVLLDFKNSKIKILVATDVVSRGIDIDDIETVINFDAPMQAEDYVHRIGRTARAGAKGQAITLITPRDYHRLQKIEKLIERTIPRRQMPQEIADIAPAVNEDNLKSRSQSDGNHRKQYNKPRNSKPNGASGGGNRRPKSGHYHRKPTANNK